MKGDLMDNQVFQDQKEKMAYQVILDLKVTPVYLVYQDRLVFREQWVKRVIQVYQVFRDKKENQEIVLK